MEQKNHYIIRRRLSEIKSNKTKLIILNNCNLNQLPLEFEESFNWVETISLAKNQKLNNISLLRNQVNLKWLDISNTEVENLEPLASLKQLQNLNISNTLVSDISPISGLKNLKVLRASKNQINDLRPIVELCNLRELILSENPIKDLTPISSLVNLEWLSISNTDINNLEPLKHLTLLYRLEASNTNFYNLTPLSNLLSLREFYMHNSKVYDINPLKSLKNLCALSLSNTEVEDLLPISALHKIIWLDVSNSKVKDLTAIESISDLETLSVSNTDITEIEVVKKLKKIRSLNISNTKISDLKPIKDLISKGIQVKYRNFSLHSGGINITNCPLLNPPKEIATQGNEAILRYWEQIELQNGSVELFEAKLIIIGEGGTGKTTLFEKLKNPLHQIGNTFETHGINIHEGLPFQHTSIGENTFYANLWDFGGQDLQYMTHQFFLTPRALYVLLMDARRESPNLAYWFKIISLLGRERENVTEKVNLLLVFNKRNNSTGFPQYQDILKFYEDTIEAHFLEVDLAINDFRFENLQKTIQDHLVRLPIVKTLLPRLWKDVREDLRSEAKMEKYISTRRFAEICSKYNIYKEEDQWLLSSYLHQLGSLLHFQNDRGLRSWVILNPQWAVDGVYSFLMDEGIKSNYGHFSESDFIKLLAVKSYTRDEADLILQLMTKNNFDICYEVRPGRYVAAQLLPDVAPKYPWFSKNVLQFRYQYSIMPKGLVSRLIVRLSDYLEKHAEKGEHVVWKKGGVFRFNLREGKCRVLLREDDAESKSGLRQILIDVIGDMQARKYALHKIRDAVEDLHENWFRGIKVDEMVPCCCSECLVSDNPQLFKLENLLKRSTKRKDTSCDFSGEDIQIQTLLEGIYNDQEIQGMTQQQNHRLNQ